MLLRRPRGMPAQLRRCLAGFAATVLLAACGSGGGAAGATAPGSCPATLTVADTVYDGVAGSVPPNRLDSGVLTAVIPACDDEGSTERGRPETVDVFKVEGQDVFVAKHDDRTLYVRRGLDSATLPPWVVVPR